MTVLSRTAAVAAIDSIGQRGVTGLSNTIRHMQVNKIYKNVTNEVTFVLSLVNSDGGLKNIGSLVNGVVGGECDGELWCGMLGSGLVKGKLNH